MMLSDRSSSSPVFDVSKLGLPRLKFAIPPCASAFDLTQFPSLVDISPPKMNHKFQNGLEIEFLIKRLPHSGQVGVIPANTVGPLVLGTILRSKGRLKMELFEQHLKVCHYIILFERNFQH